MLSMLQLQKVKHEQNKNVSAKKARQSKKRNSKRKMCVCFFFTISIFFSIYFVLFKKAFFQMDFFRSFFILSIA